MQTTILGLGLIGGSVARALRAAPRLASARWPVTGWSPGGIGPRQARAAGAIDRVAGSLPEALEGAELVVICAPPLAAIDLVGELGRQRGRALSVDATVTDVTSTKAAVMAAARSAGLPFVGGHPMAGREQSGFDAADAGLFAGRPWIVVQGATSRIIDAERVERLVEACGADPVQMDAQTHDRAVAAISHLPLLLSVAMVEAVAGVGDDPDLPGWPTERALAASGWRDMARLARGDAEMGAGILATNAEAVTGRIREVQAVLDEWLLLLSDDPEATARAAVGRLRAARRRAQGER